MENLSVLLTPPSLNREAAGVRFYVPPIFGYAPASGVVRNGDSGVGGARTAFNLFPRLQVGQVVFVPGFNRSGQTQGLFQELPRCLLEEGLQRQQCPGGLDDARRGVLIVGGDTGEALGDSLYKGRIYVRGRIEALGSDAVQAALTDADIALLAGALADAGLDAAPADYKKIVSGKKRYNFDWLACTGPLAPLERIRVPVSSGLPALLRDAGENHRAVCHREHRSPERGGLPENAPTQELPKTMAIACQRSSMRFSRGLIRVSPRMQVWALTPAARPARVAPMRLHRCGSRRNSRRGSCSSPGASRVPSIRAYPK